MPIRSPSRSRAEYTSYEFTSTAGFDYNYDPSSSRCRTPNPNPLFDPYTDAYTSPSTPSPQPYPSPTPAALPIPTSPSPQYIAESHKPSTQLPTPSAARKLLILDLNGTLVYRSPHASRPQYRPRRRPYHNHNPDLSPPLLPADAGPASLRSLRAVHPRPYMRSFREYLLHPRTREWLDTMVWSSAQPHSVADMVDKCFGVRTDELLAVWARDTLGLEEKDYHRKTQTTKDLARPWAKLPISPSNTATATDETPQAHSAHTTLLLDDSPRKAHLQPYNHLCIREYSGQLRNTDLQVRAAERRRERERELEAERETEGAEWGVDEFGRERRKPDTASEDSLADAAVDAGNKKKRKRAKKKKTTTQLTEPDLPASDVQETEEGGYDPTLLAVIGVLERIKLESNVAGWMRAGGLSASPSPSPSSSLSAPAPAPPPLAQADSTESLVGEVEAKRRRVVDGGDARVGMDGEGAEGLENIGDTGQWFEDAAGMKGWVGAGVKALEVLGIEIVPGVDG